MQEVAGSHRGALCGGAHAEIVHGGIVLVRGTPLDHLTLLVLVEAMLSPSSRAMGRCYHTVGADEDSLQGEVFCAPSAAATRRSLVTSFFGAASSRRESKSSAWLPAFRLMERVARRKNGLRGESRLDTPNVNGHLSDISCFETAALRESSLVSSFELVVWQTGCG